jgi:tetratricopeptide (TPR) repeat protein
MNPDSKTPDIESLAEQFVEQLHAGSTPSIEGFAAEHPELAGEIRELFPTILNMEMLRRQKSSGRPLPKFDAESVPEQLGDYAIIREIGRGGMGIVYQAEQLSLKRTVALKILPRGYLADPNRRERFRLEAQTAARLHHTSIVPVHGIGNAEGYDFFVMQYIDGISLDRLIQQHSAAGQSIDWRRVARLGVQAAMALHYAHQQGVLHRDMKPANLLLGEDASADRERTWIADFGLALPREEVRSAGELVGTPGTLRYMPIEQLEGKPSARSDIYSLGLTLYELLAGRPGYEGSSPSQLLANIRGGELTPIDRIRTDLPLDFVAILGKAIDKESSKRYQSGKELADDLRRLLENRPVHARRITAIGRMNRWMQRNPLAALLSAIAAASLLGVITATTVGYFSARAGQQRESQLRAAEQEQRLREAEQRRRAETALQVAVESLEELFTQIESNRTPGQRLAESEAQDMLDALERMLAFYQRLAEQGQQGPQLRLREAETLRRMGDLHRVMRHYDPAEESLRRALVILDDLIDAAAAVADSKNVTAEDVAARIQRARANYTLGRVYRDRRQREEGSRLIQTAIEELESLPDRSHQRRHIAELLRRFREDLQDAQPTNSNQHRLPEADSTQTKASSSQVPTCSSQVLTKPTQHLLWMIVEPVATVEAVRHQLKLVPTISSDTVHSRSAASGSKA